MLIKYLPFGKFWNKKYDETSVFNKFIKAIDTTFFYYDKIIEENFKIFSKEKVLQWTEYLGFPDTVFYYDRVYFYEKFKIKLNRKYDTLDYVIKCFESLDIEIEVIQNSNNTFIYKVIDYPNPAPVPLLPLTLPAPLNGGIFGLTEANFVTYNFLDRVLPITTKLILIQE